jgi:hypothetical protein
VHQKRVGKEREKEEKDDLICPNYFTYFTTSKIERKRNEEKLLYIGFRTFCRALY